jgi:LPXTG-motif cell wall-anchored protein
MSMVFAPAAMGQAVGQVLGCEDFATQQDAQVTLDAGTGDLSLIDADGDGVACENFDYGATDSGNAATPVGQQNSTYQALSERCAVFGSGFGTQLDAQAFYENNPADFELVDPNGDGQVCTAEDFTFAQGQGEQQPVDNTATQYADDDVVDSDEVAALPDTGGIPLSGLAAIGGVALIASGLLLRHRLS